MAERSLHSAAVKTFIGNIITTEKRSRIIWVQGNIINTNLSRDEITLSDESGSIRVGNVNANASGTEWIKEGVYCMVIGGISENNNKKIHAIKLTDLSAKPLEKQTWPKLVVHQQIYLDN